jgi:YD repeat-containing protein
MSVFRRNLIAASVVLTSLALPLSATAASTTTYTYDAFGQLVALTSTAGRSVAYTYDAAGNRTNMTASGAHALNQATPNLAAKTPGGDKIEPAQATQASLYAEDESPGWRPGLVGKNALPLEMMGISALR